MRNFFDESLHIPRQARDLAGFRAWAVSPSFPERGRIDYLAGDLEVRMSPEDLYTHGLVKSAIATALHRLVVDRELTLGPSGYKAVKRDEEGWLASSRLGLNFRLARREVRPGRRTYRLEHDGPG